MLNSDKIYMWTFGKKNTREGNVSLSHIQEKWLPRRIEKGEISRRNSHNQVIFQTNIFSNKFNTWTRKMTTDYVRIVLMDSILCRRDFTLLRWFEGL